MTLELIKWYGYTDTLAESYFQRTRATERTELRYGTNQFAALYLINVIYYSDIRFCERVRIEYLNFFGAIQHTTNLKSRYCTKRKPKFKKGQNYDICYRESECLFINKVFSDYQDWFDDLLKYGFDDAGPPGGEDYWWTGNRSEANGYSK